MNNHSCLLVFIAAIAFWQIITGCTNPSQLMDPNENAGEMSSLPTKTAGKPLPDSEDDRFLNKKIALIIWNSEDKKDVRIVHGILTRTEGQWAAENPEKGWRIPLNIELFQRIRPVTMDDSPVLGDADFGLSLSMASMPENDPSGYKKTGLQLK